MSAPNVSRSSSTKPTLKPSKTLLCFKKDNISQCRLCLRVVPKVDTEETTSSDRSHQRLKILDSVGVRITNDCQVKSVCVNCLLLVDIIYNFRLSCRRANSILESRLVMMHPGQWLSNENRQTLVSCLRLVERNRAEVDGLFNYTGFEREKVRQFAEPNKTMLEVEKEKTPNPGPYSIETVFVSDGMYVEIKEEEASDSDESEQTDEVVTSVDLPVAQVGDEDRILGGRNFRDYMCELCGKTMQSSFAESHHNRHHLNTSPHECIYPGCRKRFPSKIYMHMHFNKYHTKESVVPQFECSVCSKKIKGKLHYEHHLKIHDTKPHPLKQPCQVCGKYFYKRYLKDHMFVHTGELPYCCEFCDRKFAARTNLMQHRRKYHADLVQQLENNSSNTDVR
ncbi:zinc finger protein Gfi-1b-like [Armigeres subalbatus]|uniref:zinc finger protein Gfi-1b-like n=1 Tax=Armigeres subalbatus TaxID=124917 RepID=UPI002ED20122